MADTETSVHEPLTEDEITEIQVVLGNPKDRLDRGIALRLWAAYKSANEHLRIVLSQKFGLTSLSPPNGVWRNVHVEWDGPSNRSTVTVSYTPLGAPLPPHTRQQLMPSPCSGNMIEGTLRPLGRSKLQNFEPERPKQDDTNPPFIGDIGEIFTGTPREALRDALVHTMGQRDVWQAKASRLNQFIQENDSKRSMAEDRSLALEKKLEAVQDALRRFDGAWLTADACIREIKSVV